MIRLRWVVLFVLMACGGALAAPVPRDYSSAPPIPMAGVILQTRDIPWQYMPGGVRRKVFFNDRLTFVLFEVHGPMRGPIKTHHHKQDQITYVIEGRALVGVGGKQRIVGPGGLYIAPSNVEHGVLVLSRHFVGLDVFTPTREDFRKKP